jgi:hypothetical protein
MKYKIEFHEQPTVPADTAVLMRYNRDWTSDGFSKFKCSDPDSTGSLKHQELHAYKPNDYPMKYFQNDVLAMFVSAIRSGQFGKYDQDVEFEIGDIVMIERNGDVSE